MFSFEPKFAISRNSAYLSTGISRSQCQVHHVYWSHVVRCHVMCPYQSAVNRAVKMCHYMLRLRAEILTFIFLFMVFDFFKLTMFGMNRPSVPTSNLIFFFRNLSTEVICEWCPSLIGCGLKSAGQSESRELLKLTFSSLNCHLRAKITKIMTRLNSWILTNSTYL